MEIKSFEIVVCLNSYLSFPLVRNLATELTLDATTSGDTCLTFDYFNDLQSLHIISVSYQFLYLNRRLEINLGLFTYSWSLMNYDIILWTYQYKVLTINVIGNDTWTFMNDLYNISRKKMVNLSPQSFEWFAVYNI